MKADQEPAADVAPATEDSREYATPEEVEKEIRSLTDADHVKLMIIARSYCKSRRFSSGVMEPEELVSEALLKTLQMHKKWNKAVSMLKHLDRAMENLSGHLARERSKIIPFPDGLTPEQDSSSEEDLTDGADEVLFAREGAEKLLTSVFGDDLQARAVFMKRAEGFSVPEVMMALRLSNKDYETVARRIRRKISKFSNQVKN